MGIGQRGVRQCGEPDPALGRQGGTALHPDRLGPGHHVYSSNDQQMKEYEKIAKNWADMAAKDIKEINSLLITPAGKEAFQKYLTYRASYRESSSNTLTLSREHKTEQAMPPYSLRHR